MFGSGAVISSRFAHHDTSMFLVHRPVIAMIHVGALPGTPACRASLRELVQSAVEESATYQRQKMIIARSRLRYFS
jgi:hypothetical protein